MTSLAHAGTVIAHNDLKINSADLKDIFSGDKSSIEGVKVVIVDNKAALDDFCTKVMKMDSGKYSSMWAKKSFRDGVPSPKSKTSDSEVLDFVKSTPGAVSYVSGAATNGVKSVSGY